MLYFSVRMAWLGLSGAFYDNIYDRSHYDVSTKRIYDFSYHHIGIIRLQDRAGRVDTLQGSVSGQDGQDRMGKSRLGEVRQRECAMPCMRCSDTHAGAHMRSRHTLLQYFTLPTLHFPDGVGYGCYDIV